MSRVGGVRWIDMVGATILGLVFFRMDRKKCPEPLFSYYCFLKLMLRQFPDVYEVIVSEYNT